MINDIDKSSIEMCDWHCCTCSCVQWMPKDKNEHLRKNHKPFYCVNGHANYYGTKTDIEEVQGKLMNEYAKNAQLETKIKDLEKEIQRLSKSAVNRIFKT